MSTYTITPESLENDINEAVPRLLQIARELSVNEISDNCKFILSEIKNSEQNFFIRRRLKIKENERKSPHELKLLLPKLLNIFSDLYDINLEIYKALSDFTIVDIRYYLKSSMDEEYRQTIKNNSPMLHCKVAHPIDYPEKVQKFDINWEYNEVNSGG